MYSLLILNGPNLNLLGGREPRIYGVASLDEIRALCLKRAGVLGVEVEFQQSNHEGHLIDAIQGASGRHNGIILNAAALTHTSVALMDAVLAIDLPVVEVHLSNIHKREDFRARSFISKAAAGVVFGFGANGYLLAMDGLVSILRSSAEARR